MKNLILTLSLILGLAKPVNAKITGGEILQNGKIIHTNVVNGVKKPLFIHYHVLYKERYYTCQFEDLFNKETATVHDNFFCREVMEVKDKEEFSLTSDSLEHDAQKELLIEWGRKIHTAIIEEFILQAADGGFNAKGFVLLNITVSTNGVLEKAEVAEPSGNDSFDDEALKITRRASFPSAPSALTKQTYKFQIPISR